MTNLTIDFKSIGDKRMDVLRIRLYLGVSTVVILSEILYTTEGDVYDRLN